MFKTVEDYLSKEDWNNELVFVFGDCDVDSAIPPEFVYKIKNSKFMKAEKLCAAIDPQMYNNGMIFVANDAVGKKDGPSLQQLQMHLLADYYRKHFFASKTPTQPSPAVSDLLRGLKDPSRSISQMKNMPWLLRYPLADKLRDAKVGLPVLILTSGPSFKLIKQHLKSLSQRFLIVCIARSLQDCLDEDVEPDFVVQYDTNLEQSLFYKKISKLNNTTLISLSSANISEYAWKFRSIFFRATFNSDLLKNTFLMRDSTESSLLSCMGLAEIIGAPEALIAGANLSWSAGRDRYSAGTHPTDQDDRTTDDYHIREDCEVLSLVDRKGEKAQSLLGYVAAASRASEFAREIQANTGTRFLLTSDDGILSPMDFPATSLDAMLEAPLIDRNPYWEKIDNASKTKEDINLKATIQHHSHRAKFISIQELNFQIRKYNPEFEFSLRNEFTLLMKNVRSAIMPPPCNEAQVHNFIKQWAQAYRDATKISSAYLLAEKDILPVLCLDSDYEKTHEHIDGFFPKERLELTVITSFLYKDKSQHKSIVDMNLGHWLNQQHLVFVSFDAANRYSFVFDTMEETKIIPLPPF